MLSGFLRRLFCCTRSASVDDVVPTESSTSTDGYEFVEVKPGRVLRVSHVIQDQPGVEEPAVPEKSFSCKRKLSVCHGGQLYIENNGDRVSGGSKTYQNGDTLPTGRADVELTDCGNSSEPTCTTESKTDFDLSQLPRKGGWKLKRTVVTGCERKITACKGTHPDVLLFFIHGVGGSLDIWRSQLDFFSKQGYEMIAADLAGHGASSAPELASAYTFYALAEDIRHIFKRYARKRNILIGHSYGVSFCTFLAHEYPENIHKMVLINGGGPTGLEPSSCSIFNLPSCALHCLSPILRWCFFMAGFARHGAKEKQLLKDTNAFNVPSFVLRAIMSGQYWPEGDEAYHAEITVPTLLIHGTHDKFVSVEEDQHMAEILLMGFLKVVEDGSHMVMMECPDAVNKLMLEFLHWEPATPSLPKNDSKTHPETARDLSGKSSTPTDLSKI